MEFLPAPERPAPPLGEVHVWRAELGRAGSDRALRGVLSLYLGEEPSRIELVRGEHGKPRLAVDPGRLSFNLSHSAGLTLVAVCHGREVGVDVERIKPRRDLLALAERALAPGDVSAVRGAPLAERADVFYELWARHEARLKCLGVGIGGGAVDAALPIAVETIDVAPCFAAAVAVSGTALPLRGWTLDRALPSGGAGFS